MEVDLVEDDIRLVLDEYNSNFFTNELKPGLYTFKDLYEALFTILKPKTNPFNNPVVIELDDLTVKSKLIVKSGNIAKRLDEISFFNTNLGFTPHWDYKHYDEYNSQKIASLTTTNKTHLKCDVIDGSILSGLRQPILLSFLLDKPSGYKVFLEPETIHFKKINKFVLNTIIFS